MKEEKATLKTLRAELQQVKEELFDVKNEKEVIEKVREGKKHFLIAPGDL